MHCYSLCNLSMKLMMTWVLSRRNYDDPYCLDHWVVFCAINLRKLPIFMFASQWTTAAGWVITFFSELSTVHFLEENIGTLLLTTIYLFVASVLSIVKLSPIMLPWRNYLNVSLQNPMIVPNWSRYFSILSSSLFIMQSKYLPSKVDI